MTELDQLKKIVFEGSFDAESRKRVAELEKHLHKILVAENLASNPVIQEYVDYLKTESQRCTFLLSEERKLTDLERQVLFEKRDICKHFTELFTGEGKQAVEQQIKDLLDVAKNS